MWRFLVLFLATGGATIGGLHLSQTPTATLGTRCIVSLCGAVAILLLRKVLTEKAQSNSFGSAAFATMGEMADLVQKDTEPVLPGSVLLGKHDKRSIVLSPEQARRHGIVVGGSGSGKSFSFFLPNAQRLRGTSCVFTDPKSEMFHYTSGFHNSLRFAPCEPQASEGFNWIPYCRSPRLAEVAARAIVECGKTPNTEPVWLDLEAAFLASLFGHTSMLSVPTPLTMYRLFTQQNQKTLLSQLAASPSAAAREQANIFNQASERMRGSIVPVVAARLQFMRDPLIMRFTSATLTPPRFAELRKAPTALYWCLHEKDIPRLRPLTSLFFTLLLEELNEESRDDGEGVPVLMFLDEFGVIGALPDFEATIALARGRNIGFWLGVQSLSQLESLYGRSAAQTILTNCSTKVALSGLDVETAGYFSRTLGQETVSRKLRSWQWRRLALFHTSLGESLQEHGRFLLSPDEVRRLGEGAMLVVTGNRKPLVLQKIRYDAPPRTASTTPLGTAQGTAFESGQSLWNSLPPFPEDID